jgi:hypothetical protein
MNEPAGRTQTGARRNHQYSRAAQLLAPLNAVLVDEADFRAPSGVEVPTPTSMTWSARTITHAADDHTGAGWADSRVMPGCLVAPEATGASRCAISR